MRLTRKVNNEQLKEAKEFGEPFVREYEENDYCELEGTCDRDRLNKLGQLEDIEEELGIDLITLFKALRQDYVYYEDTEVCVRGMNTNGLIVYDKGFGWGECDYTLYWEDYGKTWALTKEELEK